MILSNSGQVFDEIPLKSWFKRDLKVEFLSEIVMGKIMKSGKVVLLLSGRQVYLVFFSEVLPISGSLDSLRNVQCPIE